MIPNPDWSRSAGRAPAVAGGWGGNGARRERAALLRREAGRGAGGAAAVATDSWGIGSCKWKAGLAAFVRLAQIFLRAVALLRER